MKLKELTDELDNILDEIENKILAEKHLNNSEILLFNHLRNCLIQLKYLKIEPIL